MVSMNQSRIRVLVVDDSALARQVLTDALSKDVSIEVVGVARDGEAALRAAAHLQPDVVTLDIEMPGMSGFAVLDELAKSGTAVIIVSSFVDSACDNTFRALDKGAFDFVAKPSGMARDGAEAMARELVAKVKAARQAKRERVSVKRIIAAAPTAKAAPRSGASRGTIVAIGASTGGPEALQAVITALPADCPPIVIVQHMPERFTSKFAQRLHSMSQVSVKEAVDGDLVRPGQVLLAPGTTHHMVLKREAKGVVVRLETSAPVMHHRPSVDILFRSCADVLGRHAVGVLLTGMGTDGARGLLAMRRAGAETVAQDEKTSLVYGMPMEAASIGAAMHVLPLDHIAGAILDLSAGRSRVASNG